MQPIAVLLIGAVLGSWRGAAAASLYLLEGFAGLPVFAQGHGGATWLVVDRNRFPQLSLGLPAAYRDDRWVLYRL